MLQIVSKKTMNKRQIHITLFTYFKIQEMRIINKTIKEKLDILTEVNTLEIQNYDMNYFFKLKLNKARNKLKIKINRNRNMSPQHNNSCNIANKSHESNNRNTNFFKTKFCHYLCPNRIITSDRTIRHIHFEVKLLIDWIPRVSIEELKKLKKL